MNATYIPLPFVLNGRNLVEEKPLTVMYSEFKNHRRLQTFVEKGCACVHPGCTRRGTRFIKSVERKTGSAHWDLYTDDLHLMTVDHIVPKSHGGTNDISNRQPMCAEHNEQKGSKLDHLTLECKVKALNYRSQIAPWEFKATEKKHVNQSISSGIHFKPGNLGRMYSTFEGKIWRIQPAHLNLAAPSRPLHRIQISPFNHLKYS